MMRPRIIPVLLIQGKGLVKTIRFDESIYVGDPLNAVRIFNEKEVDELIVLDIAASRKGEGPNFSLLSAITQECFMPLCYGGGITSFEDAKRLFGMGVEKVSINSAALTEPKLITEIARTYGSQSVVASIDCKRALLGRHSVHSFSNRKLHTKDPIAFARQLEAAGAGEILLTSVDRDGERDGFDLELCARVAESVSVPVVVCGGGGKLSHFREAITAGASAAAGGSFFVFQGKHRAVLITYPKPEEIELLLE